MSHRITESSSNRLLNSQSNVLTQSTCANDANPKILVQIILNFYTILVIFIFNVLIYDFDYN
jgi:hypothetical protein